MVAIRWDKYLNPRTLHHNHRETTMNMLHCLTIALLPLAIPGFAKAAD